MTDTIRDLLISLSSHMAYMQGQLEARHELDDPEGFYWYRESVLLRQKVTDALGKEEPAVSEGREPVAVTGQLSDQDLLDIAASTIEPYERSGIAINEYEPETDCAVEAYGSELIAFARAVLARWGNPVPAPPADGEVAEMVCFLQVGGSCPVGAKLTRDQCRRAAELLQRQATAYAICERERLHQSTRAADLEVERQALVPVPVAERPWEREGWCDAEGRCWIGYPGLNFSIADTGDTDTTTPEWGLEPPSLKPEVSRCWCLPAHALPLPEVGE